MSFLKTALFNLLKYAILICSIENHVKWDGKICDRAWEDISYELQSDRR